MTGRTVLLTLCGMLLLLCALSTRGAVFWLLFWLLCVMLLTGLLSALWTSRTLKVYCTLDEDHVIRGGQAGLSIELSHRCPLPVAPIRLVVCGAGARDGYALYTAVTPFFTSTITQTIHCPHVGEYPSGISETYVQDVFGLFRVCRRTGFEGNTLVVQPQIYETQALSFSPGDSDIESVSRAFEDASLPTDLRAYQQGDELKKVHWKLSMRRKELIVRVYEQPMRPDALLLIDCAPPMAGEGMEASVRDAICEAAASLAKVSLEGGAPVRMPLFGGMPTDVNAQKPEDLGMVCEALGRLSFDAVQEFERILMLETRRMRRTGSTAIVTSRLNPNIAEMILSIRRMGPKVRVLLAADAEDEDTARLVRRLTRNDIEVTPVAAES